MRQFMLVLVFVCFFGSFLGKAHADVRRLCIPKVATEDTRGACYGHFNSLVNKLGKRYVLKRLGDTEVRFNYPRSKAKDMLAAIKALNDASKDSCAAYLLYFCRDWYSGTGTKLRKRGHVFKFNVFKTQTMFDVRRLKRKKLIRVRYRLRRRQGDYVRTGKVDGYLAKMISEPRLKRYLSPARKKCESHSDCNGTTALLRMCYKGYCKKVACSQATSVGDLECAPELYCGKPDPSVMRFACSRKLPDGSKCDRARMCKANYCSSKGECGRSKVVRTPPPPPRIASPKAVKSLNDACSASDPCGSGGILVCDTTIGKCRMATGKFCSSSSVCLSADYCSKAGRCALRLKEGQVCGKDGVPNDGCEAGLVCFKNTCSKLSTKKDKTHSPPDTRKPDTGGHDHTHNHSEVMVSLLMGGGVLLDLENPNRHTGGVELGLRIMPRHFWLGGFARFLVGTSTNFFNAHIMFQGGLAARVFHRGDHWVHVKLSYMYWGRNIVTATYHETSRHGMMADVVYDAPLGKLIGVKRLYLSLNFGLGFAERTLDPYNKLIVGQLQLSAFITYTF